MLATRLQRPRTPTSARTFFTDSKPPPASTLPVFVVTTALFVWWLYPTDAFAELSDVKRPSVSRYAEDYGESSNDISYFAAATDAWPSFARRFESFSHLTQMEWMPSLDGMADMILPEWAKYVPGYLRKLQRELSMAPGSLADEIWREAHDPFMNPEIRYAAKVRVSNDLCDEEKAFLVRRRRIARVALARYLGIEESEVHPDDVPTIALCGSGGGLRALMASAGSLMATEEDGLLDCLTYTAGVSGSCWLQAIFYSSVGAGRLDRVLDHLKARAGVHIAYPPTAFQSLISAPTSKYLLSGMVEKLKGDPHAELGLVDAYGLLLSARFLVPKGELAVDERDFKLSNQRNMLRYGQHPLPIYTAVRHEIPTEEPNSDSAVATVTEAAKEEAKQEAWFQWFEITPYEFFCEEFNAGIPTWAMGRRFNAGSDVPPSHGFHLPEMRMPLLMGIFGSAFCATLSHYYQEIRPVMRMTGLMALDDLISDRNEDLSKVHPIDPARIPNYVYGMDVGLPRTAPQSVRDSEYLQLMDAGMSNNLPIYPLLRPGRNVEVLIAFDASADTKTDNWLSVADGYARQRGIKGWPVGIGWPKDADARPENAADELEKADAHTPREADEKLSQAKAQQEQDRESSTFPDKPALSSSGGGADDLGYCTVWVGSSAERSTTPPPPSKALDDSTHWHLSSPDAGIAVVYLPFLTNPAVPGVNPGETDYLSTWNFVYTPEQVDSVVELARANYQESRDKIRGCVRAVYERKKRGREEGEEALRRHRYRVRVRRGEGFRLGEGDLFS